MAKEPSIVTATFAATDICENEFSAEFVHIGMWGARKTVFDSQVVPPLSVKLRAKLTVNV